ncbi:putative Zf-FLZ domain-containing protein [Medicago truncatula]|uniref:DUF581 family protein n=1 Tax=Medicago truncatula TaxID=3880 RepID=G7JLK0_MEDTR|nr:FCS-Like Zinc finger 15 [Medicago truncatula]AES91895.1 DUF581 family protein [Medicago truncatula]RHN64291.1 putative Zf-FLZ domain-containing protein [Medicago truncatula]
MVGLGVVLEEQQPHKKKCNININNNNNTYQVINKTTMMLSSTINNNASYPLSYHSPFKVSTFLDQCFLCSKKLLPGKDIYMYKGDRAFCSVDCRCKHILADEEEATKKQNIFEE